MLGVAQRKNLFAPSAHLTFPLFPREKSGGEGKRVGTGRISSLVLAVVHRYIFVGKFGNIFFLPGESRGRSFGTKTAAPVSAAPYITSLKRKRRRRRRRAKRFLLHSSLPKGKRRRKTVP